MNVSLLSSIGLFEGFITRVLQVKLSSLLNYYAHVGSCCPSSPPLWSRLGVVGQVADCCTLPRCSFFLKRSLKLFITTLLTDRAMGSAENPQ